MSVFLLDVNVLLALCDSAHSQHDAAHEWFAASGRKSWATCPITENGFVRIASHPSYPNQPGGVDIVTAVLRDLCAGDGHVFWPDDISLRDVITPGAIVTHGHVTDVYLLGLAARNGGKLATFDRRIPASAVKRGRESVELIAG